VRRPALLLTAPLLALALTGCLDQPEEANDNGPLEVPSLAPSVFRTPVPVESPPLTVEVPGETRSPG
jgi:hypothetical protein